MPRKKFDKTVAGADDAFSCPDGSPHQWDYIQREQQLYRCRRCGLEVTKSELKKETD